MRARDFAVLLLSLPLLACQTPEEIAAADDSQCRSYGAKPGSDAYVNCRVAQQKISQRRIHRQRQQHDQLHRRRQLDHLLLRQEVRPTAERDRLLAR